MPDNVLICTRVDDFNYDEGPQVQSKVDRCAMCQHAVWRALSSARHARAVCEHCMPALIRGVRQRGEAIELGRLSKRQLRDIKRTLE
jgi:uncharacterized protein YjiS (DUF1127 family)